MFTRTWLSTVTASSPQKMAVMRRCIVSSYSSDSAARLCDVFRYGRSRTHTHIYTRPGPTHKQAQKQLTRTQRLATRSPTAKGTPPPQTTLQTTYVPPTADQLDGRAHRHPAGHSAPSVLTATVVKMLSLGES